MSFRKVALSIAVSAVCLYFVLRNVRWDEVVAHLREVDPPLFVTSMLLMLAAYFLMTWRWQHLLDPLEIPGTLSRPVTPGESRGIRHHASLPRLYAMMMTGYFFNSFFPARA